MSRDDFDPVATVVDWLDACKAGQLDDLLALYAENALIECRCSRTTLTGRTALAAYWEPKLRAKPPAAFTLDDVALDGQSVSLDYQSFEGMPVRIRFQFNEAGKIQHTSCGALDRSVPSRW
jgi:ketosteroid isomerase-like protein